jgi:hypothetical protein
MIGNIKVVGANDIHQEWMDKTFENCELISVDTHMHVLKIPEKEDLLFEITKTRIFEKTLVLEGYCAIDNSLGKIAIELSPHENPIN